MVVADMDAAYAQVTAHGGSSISDGGPATLPEATGGIRAWKFRDPLGHPLELSWFPSAVAPAQWRARSAGQMFLGIDHSAIAVADIEASVAFYAALGMTVAARQVNTGPTQDRLDGLPGAEVDIVSLVTPDEGPHVELLGYRHPRSTAAPIAAAAIDLAATRLIFAVEEIGGLADRLRSAGARMVSDGLAATDGGGRAALVRDPDGHLLELRD